MERARELQLQKEAGWLKEAIKSLRSLVQEEPGNFEGNFRLGDLLLAEVTKEGKRIPHNIENAIKHLSIAKQVRPDSWRVWLLASNAWHYRFEETQDYGDLDKAIERAKEASDKAEEFMDSDGMHRSKMELADLYLGRSRDPAGDGAKELAEAAALCEAIKNAFNGVQIRRRSDLLVTMAMVQLAQGKTPRKTIKEMLDTAVSIDQKNARAHRAVADFFAGGDGSDSGMSLVSG